MSIKKALTGSLLAASLLITAVSLTGVADPLPVKAEKACEQGKPCASGKKCGHGHKGGFSQAAMTQFDEKIGLSESQKTQFSQIRKEGEEQAKPVAEALFAKRRALYEYLSEPQATEAGALAKQAEINELRNQLSQQRLSGMFRLKAVLSPEQQQKAAELMRGKMADCDKHKQSEKSW